MGKLEDAKKRYKNRYNQNKDETNTKLEQSGKLLNAKKRYQAKTIGADTLHSDLENLFTTIGTVYDGWQTRETMENTLSSIRSMNDRIGKYQEYSKKYGDGADLSELQGNLKNIMTDWDELSRQYARHKDADSYKKAIQSAKDSLAEEEKMKTDNLDVVKKELTDIEKAYKNAKVYNDKISQSSLNVRSRTDAENFKKFYDQTVNERDSYAKSVGFDNYKELEKAYGEKKKYLNRAEWLQKGKELSSVDAKDFEEKSKYVAPEKKYGIQLVNKDEDAYKYINDEDFRAQVKIGAESSGDAAILTNGYEYITDEEKKIYNYYYNSGEKEKAREYLNTIAESLGSRKAIAEYEKFKGNTVKEMFYGVNAGLNQFMSGMRNVVNTKDEYIPVNATQQLSGLIRDDLNYEHGGLGTVPYDLITTTSNMLPSVLTSTIIGKVNPGLGANIGATLMGTSASGNAYQEMLNLGYDKTQSRAYSILVGVSEAYLQKMMGGIGKLGGVGKNLSKAIKSIDNAFGRFAINYGGSVLAEGIEEAAQEVLTPIFKSVATGEDMESIDWGEVAYSGLLGVLSGGVMEGGPQILNARAEVNRGKDIKAKGRTQDLFDLANNPEIAEAYETFTRYAKKGINAENVTNAQLGRLYNEVKSEEIKKYKTYNDKNASDVERQKAGRFLNELKQLDQENTELIETKKKVKENAEKYNVDKKSEIDIKNVEFKDGNAIANTEKGEISVNDVKLSEKDANLLGYAEVIANEHGEDMANLFISQYDSNTELDRYANDFNLATSYAENEFSFNHIIANKGTLSATDVSNIYKETVIRAAKEKQAKIEELNKAMADGKFYKATINDSAIDYDNTSVEGKINWNSLTERQRKAVTFVKGFAQAVGINLNFVVNQPKFNGQYVKETNTITLNLDNLNDTSLVNAVDSIIPAMSHETTHWMKDKSPELWASLNNVVFDTLIEHYNTHFDEASALLGKLGKYGDKVTEQDLLDAEIKRLKNGKYKGQNVSNEALMDEAREEIIARACEDLLKMSEQGKKIFSSLSIKEQNSLVGKIKALIKDLLDWITETLNLYDASSNEAKIMRQYEEKLKEASKIWDNMLESSVVTNQSLEKSGVYHHTEVNILESSKDMKTTVFSEKKNTTDNYSKIYDMQIEVNQLTEKIRELEESDDFGRVMDVMSDAIAKGDTERGITEYEKWLDESGYRKIRDKRDALAKELDQLRENTKASEEKERLDKEREAIEKSGLSEADYFRKQAVKEFGYTPYFVDAGYITPNGKMINFSGEKGKHYGTRGLDHRAIERIYANVSRTDAMVKFMGEGNIRIMPESPGIDISSLVEPSKEQYATIRKFVREYANKEYLNIDLTDADGQTVGNYEYEGRISAERVVNDIKYFFENGTTREQSSISKFLYSEKNIDEQDAINTSMTMDEAKTMLEKAFVIGKIKEFYDGEYKTAEEWLRGEGASEVAMYIENEYTLIEKYLNKLQGYLDGEFYVEDILDAYLEGTLVGREKSKAKRLDLSQEYRINDKRFYSPQQIKDAKNLLSVAMQRVTNENQKEVTNARAKILLFAHNKGASELLGLSQTELNKKLRSWSGYSAKARDISTRFNNGVADSNKWTGIENCSWLVKSQVTETELESLVKEIKGSSNQYERNYIARTMLALDTHIDWTELIFDFKRGYADETRKSVRGLYNNRNRTITIGGSSGMNTVAHEMGHALDYKWHRDLFGKQTGVEHCLSENPYRLDLIEDADAQQFVKNFNIFIDSLTDVSVNYSAYTMESKETFARFVAKFVEWVEQVAGGRGFYETDYYGDKFNASHYIEFVKLLQEKAMLDSRKAKTSKDMKNTVFSEKDIYAEYLELAKNPEKNEARLRELVDEEARQSGFSTRLYHGTRKFGFTKTDVSKSDDYMSFFATDSLEVAGTYSGEEYVREIKSQTSKSFYDILPEIKTRVELATHELVDYCNNVMGYNWVDYHFMSDLLTDAFNNLEDGAFVDSVSDDIFAFCNDMFGTLASNYYHDNYNEKDMTFEGFENTNDYDKLAYNYFDYVHNIQTQIQYISVANNRGNYDLYTNTDGFLEIDAKGLSWNKIPNDSLPFGLDTDDLLTGWELKEFEDNNRQWTTRTIARISKKLGYTGVKIVNVFDDGGRGKTRQTKPATVYIFFNPETQTKSADLVTYDDNGNIIPLSERFNEKNDDIRFSEKDSEGNTLTEQQTEFFKDSKVRDEDGNLQVMWHGTYNDFTVFDIGKAGINWGGDSRLGKGFYFAYTEREAQEWGKSAKTIKAYLNIKNPLDYTQSVPKNISDEIDKYIEKSLAEFDEEKSWLTKGQYAENLENSRERYKKNFSWFVDKFKYDDNGKMTDGIREFLSKLGYDGIIAEDEVVAFYPEQIKLTTNKTPSENKDIRHSEKDPSIYDIMGENEALRKDYEKLKADFDNYKELAQLDKKITNGKEPNPEHLLTVASELLKIGNSNMDKVDLARELKKVFTYIKTSMATEEMTWRDVWDRAYPIAQKIMEESKPLTIVDDYSKGILRDLRASSFSLDETQKKEAKYIFGDHWNYNFIGNIKVKDDAPNIDVVWQELSGLYPEVFNDDIGNNKIQGLYDVIQSLRETSEYVDEYAMKEKTKMLAFEIYNKCWSVSTLETTADKYNAKIKEIKANHRKMMSDIRNEYQEKIESQIIADDIYYGKKINELKAKDKAYNEKLKALREKQREKQRELYKKFREERREAVAYAKKHLRDDIKAKADRKTYIQRITANALTLNKWMTTNSKDYHIHEGMKKPIIKLLQAIDFSSKSKLEKGVMTQKDISFREAFAEVKSMLENATNMVAGFEEFYGHNLAETIEIMCQASYNLIGDNAYVINAMSNEELYHFDKFVRDIKRTVTKLNKFHVLQHNKGAMNLASEFVKYGEEIGNLEKQHGKLGKYFKFQNRTPYYFFKDLGEVGKKIFKAFQDGWDKFAFNIKTIIDFANKTYKAKEVKQWGKETKEFKIIQRDGNERIINISVAQIMALHCIVKQEDARYHLLNGGMTLKRTDNKGNVITDYKNITLSVSDLQRILSTLTDRQIKVADALQGFINTVCTKWGNEISIARFGSAMFGIPDYFPLKVSEANVPTDNTKDIENASLFRLLNMSFTKARSKDAPQSIEIGDIFDIFAQHTSDMAKYNALALPVLDFNKWYSITGKDSNNNEYGVVQTLKSVFGDEANGYIRRFVRDLNGSQNVSRDALGNTFWKNSKVASVAANIRVMLLQPTAFYKASAILDNKYLMKASAYIKGNPFTMVKRFKKAIADAEKYCGIIQWKALGYYDTDVSKGVAEKIKHANSFQDKIVEISMKGAEFFDKLTFGTLWVACDFEIRETRKELKVGSPEFHNAVAERLREVVYATQVVDSTMTRSDMMRSPDRTDKMYTTFASEPTIAYNMLLDVVTEYQRDKQTMDKDKAKKKNSKKMRKVIIAYTVTNLMAALVESGFDIFRDDDEEKDITEFLKLYLKNFLLDMSIGNKLPYIKEAYSILQGYSSSRMDTQWMVNAYYTAASVIKHFEGDGDWEKTIKYLIKSSSDLTGIPFFNVYRDAMAFLNKLDWFDD
jgi:hypothetical protein